MNSLFRDYVVTVGSIWYAQILFISCSTLSPQLTLQMTQGRCKVLTNRPSLRTLATSEECFQSYSIVTRYTILSLLPSFVSSLALWC
jgi:hypothetical protein